MPRLGAGMIDIPAAATPIRAYTLQLGRRDTPSLSFGRHQARATRSLSRDGVVLGAPSTRLTYRVE